MSCLLFRCLWIFFAAAWICLFGWKPDARAVGPIDTEAFSVMTWNLEWFYDEYRGDNFSELAKQKSAPSREQWNWRRDAFADSIAEVSPSIVALQEVENRRVLWYLSRALEKRGQMKFQELGIEGGDHFTEQDVGFLFRHPVEVLSISQRMQTRKMRASEKYFNLTKHLMGIFLVPVGDGFERVTVLNLHLRSGKEAESLRRRQARLVHHWIFEAVSRGENVIVLGDFNTEETGDQTMRGSDIGITAGDETKPADDDLIDLTLRIPNSKRATHLSGKQFDRVLVSRSLVIDSPDRLDLVFDSIEVRQDLAIRGGQDRQSDHWDRYWEIDAEKRDLSDHYPVVATFKVQ
jgi:endonuclease/exonuclease/phosphatase family metal-dependent hydrolase